MIGVTRLQERIVEYLLLHPGSTMRDAAEACGCALSTVHRVVELEGLVRVVHWELPR